jgi:flagellin
MRINTNINSMNAIESGTNNQINSRNSLEKLSSGLKINKASDDASGLAIADKLRTQKSALEQSVANANSAVAMIQIADKAMAEQSNILDIVKQKFIQASTATTSTEGRAAIAKDVDKLLDQLNGIASQTNYNGVNLLQNGISDKTATAALTFQIGEKDNNTIVTAGSVRANDIGLGLAGTKAVVNGGSITATEARAGLKIVDDAIDKLNTYRSDFGSTQNQIESATRNMLTAKTNIAAAESVIRDVDYAEESANFNKLNIIGNASTYAQSQANAVPQSILKLLN